MCKDWNSLVRHERLGFQRVGSLKNTWTHGLTTASCATIMRIRKLPHCLCVIGALHFLGISFLSSYLWAWKRPTMTIRPQDKTLKKHKIWHCYTNSFMKLSLDMICCFTFLLQHSWFTQRTQTLLVVGVFHLCHWQAHCGAALRWCVRQRFLTVVINTICMWRVRKNADMIRC